MYLSIILEQDNQMSDTTKTISVEAVHLKEDAHRDIQQIQAFIELTTGKRPTKSETVAMTTEAGIPVMKKRMAKYVQK